MPKFPAEEIRATYESYVEMRDRIEAGELAWDALAGFFTDDASFIDPAWGRVDGRSEIEKFLVESMAGLDDWSFPHQWAMVEEDRVVARWMNRLPGRRPDGSHYEVPGYSLMIYAGGGRFSHEEDTLNMVHVVEVMGECGWKPPPEFNMPPRNPRR